MASDQPNNPVVMGSNQTTASLGNQDSTLQKKKSLSPWDEELPEETPKDQKIGGFSGSSMTQNPIVKEEPKFVVPQNIENQTALNIVDNNNLITHDSDLAIDAIDATDHDEGVRNGSMDLDIAEDVPAVVPESNNIKSESLSQTVATGQPENVSQTQNPKANVATTSPLSSVPSTNVPTPIPMATPAVSANTIASAADDDIDIFDNSFSSQKAISTDIQPASVASTRPAIAATPTPSAPMQNNSVVSNMASISAVPQQTMASQMQTQSAPALPALPQQVAGSPTEASSVGQIYPVQPKPEKKNILASLFSHKGNKTTNVQNSVPAQSVNDNIAEQMLGQPPVKRRMPLPLLISGGVLSLFFLLTLLTERGIVSIGFEKIYNPLGIEIIWGGLPRDAEKAFGQTLSVMGKKTGFKVTGDIRINIDKTIQSPVSTPLVSYADNAKMAFYIKPEKATFAVEEEEWVVVDPDTEENSTVDSSQITSDTQTDSTSTDLEGNAGEDNSTLDSSLTSDTADDSNNSSIDSDQQLDSSYEGVQTTSKELSVAVEGAVGDDGSDIRLLVDKAGISEISLKNSLGKLWVKSDKIKFSDSAEDGKWLEYNLSGLEEKNIFEEFWAGDWSQSSIRGKKVGNEKIGKTRCYDYQIDDIEIGDALSGIGITSEAISSITGHVWIGIKDKLIRKIELKITPATSSSITSLDLSLKFDSFGQIEDFEKPDSLEIITDPAPFGSNEETIEENGEVNNSQGTESEAAKAAAEKAAADALIAKNDEQRKNDLLTIKNALESYKSKYGKYPLSKSPVNLGIESNSVSSVLIPNYILALPKDPKTAEGWFYGYKSMDGKSYYLSSKLENTLDPALKMIDNISLYFLYNN